MVQLKFLLVLLIALLLSVPTVEARRRRRMARVARFAGRAAIGMALGGPIGAAIAVGIGRRRRRRRNRRPARPAAPPRANPIAPAPVPAAPVISTVITRIPPPPQPAAVVVNPCISNSWVRHCSRRCSRHPRTTCRTQCRRARRRGIRGLFGRRRRRCRTLCATTTQDRCVDVCVESHGRKNICGGRPAPTQAPEEEEEEEEEVPAPVRRTTTTTTAPPPTPAPTRAPRRRDPCDRHSARSVIRRRRHLLRQLQRRASICGDVDKKCVDRAYRAVVRQQRRISRFKRWFKATCSLDTATQHSKCHGRGYRRWLRRQNAHKERLHGRAEQCSEHDQGCTTHLLNRVSRINKRIRVRRAMCRRIRRRISRRSRSTSSRSTSSIVVAAVPKKVSSVCDSFSSFIRRMRTRRVSLHMQSRKCGDDVSCSETIKDKIVDLNKRIIRMRIRCNRQVRRTCRSKSFQRFVKTLHRRRARLQSAAQNCADEDVACVQRSLIGIVKINKRIAHRQRRCVRKLSQLATIDTTTTIVATTNTSRFVSTAVWRHALTCESMRDGFASWLKFMRAERQRLHDDACTCSARDMGCLHERFQTIMQLQRQIRKGRSDYTELITKCDACAPLRLRFVRWVKLQNARRHRLHDEICNCPEDDPECVTSRARRIKLIQQRIKDGRKHIFHMNEHCAEDDEDSFQGPARRSVAPAASAPAAASRPFFSYAKATPKKSSGAQIVASLGALILAIALLL